MYAGTMIHPGDLLIREDGLYRHIAVGMPNGMVLTNTPTRGEHLTTYSEFAAGKRIGILQVPEAFRRIALANASLILAAPAAYDLFRNNCDHTVHRAYGLPPKSPQLQAWLGGVAALGLLLLVARAG